MNAVAARLPTDRAYAAGKIKAFKADCIAHMVGEISQADHFIVTWQDCVGAVLEWSPFLTDFELSQCFRVALKAAA